MRCIDGLCGDPACWYCGRKRTPDEDADDLFDGDPMHGDEYEGLIENAEAVRTAVAGTLHGVVGREY